MLQVNRNPHRPTHAPTMLTISVVSITALLVVGQLYATLPLIDNLADDLGTSTAATAWASTAFGIAYALGMLIAGTLSDAIGRRRVAVTGLLAAAAATALVTLAPSLEALLAMRAVQGAAAALFPPVALAYLTERIAPHRRSAAITTVIAAFLASAIVAPLAASALATFGGWKAWFYISGAALIAMAILVRRTMLPDLDTATEASLGRDIVKQLAGLPRLLVPRRLRALYATTTTVMFAFVGATTLVQIAGPGTAGDPGAMQGVRAATLPAVVLVPLLAPLLARVPTARRLVVATASVTLGALVTGLATGPVTLVLALGLLTVAVAATAPALIESIGQTCPPAQRGAASSLYGFTLFIGASLGAPFVTAITALPYWAGAGVLSLVAALGCVSALPGARGQAAPT